MLVLHWDNKKKLFSFKRADLEQFEGEVTIPELKTLLESLKNCKYYLADAPNKDITIFVFLIILGLLIACFLAKLLVLLYFDKFDIEIILVSVSIHLVLVLCLFLCYLWFSSNSSVNVIKERKRSLEEKLDEHNDDETWSGRDLIWRCGKDGAYLMLKTGNHLDFYRDEKSIVSENSNSGGVISRKSSPLKLGEDFMEEAGREKGGEGGGKARLERDTGGLDRTDGAQKKNFDFFEGGGKGVIDVQQLMPVVIPEVMELSATKGFDYEEALSIKKKAKNLQKEKGEDEIEESLVFKRVDRSELNKSRVMAGFFRHDFAADPEKQLQFDSILMIEEEKKNMDDPKKFNKNSKTSKLSLSHSPIQEGEEEKTQGQKNFHENPPKKDQSQSKVFNKDISAVTKLTDHHSLVRKNSKEEGRRLEKRGAFWSKENDLDIELSLVNARDEFMIGGTVDMTPYFKTKTAKVSAIELSNEMVMGGSLIKLDDCELTGGKGDDKGAKEGADKKVASLDVISESQFNPDEFYYD